MPNLYDYFREPLYKTALARYAMVAQTLGWDIWHKLDMYNLGRAAFDSDLDEGTQRRAFDRIYDNLKGGWQVFRNPGLGYWSADQTFNALTHECQEFSHNNGLTLLTLSPNSPESEGILAGLNKLRDLKQTKWYPAMAVAKFTHFFNPMLFPIYDNQVIWTQVLNGVFKADYHHWCTANRVSPGDTSARFNLTYTLMAGDVIRCADERFMEHFGQWFRGQVVGRADERGVLDEVNRYYATAFEFVAIGAAYP